MEENKPDPNANVKLTFAIVSANLLFVLLYQILLLRGSFGGYMASAAVLYLHVLALGVSSSILSNTKYRHFAAGLGISIPLVLLIGFGTCRMF